MGLQIPVHESRKKPSIKMYILQIVPVSISRRITRMFASNCDMTLSRTLFCIDGSSINLRQTFIMYMYHNNDTLRSGNRRQSIIICLNIVNVPYGIFTLLKVHVLWNC